MVMRAKPCSSTRPSSRTTQRNALYASALLSGQNIFPVRAAQNGARKVCRSRDRIFVHADLRAEPTGHKIKLVISGGHDHAAGVEYSQLVEVRIKPVDDGFVIDQYNQIVRFPHL